MKTVNMLPLNKAEIGKIYSVISIRLSESEKKRMLDLGIIPKTNIKILQKSPMGDPIAYFIRGTVIALREEYTKKMETYDVSSNNVDKSNEENIMQIYITNLKNDIVAKLKEKEYIVKNVNIEIENDETYKIKNIELNILKKEANENKEIQGNNVIINEIETVEIQIGRKSEDNTNEEKSNLSESERKEIKKYLSSVYEIKEKQITIN